MHVVPAEPLSVPPLTPPTTPARLLALYPSTPEGEGALKRLIALLAGAATRASLAERMEWLESLSAWLRAPGLVPMRRGREAPVESAGSGRLRLLVELLREVPAWCETVRELVAVVLEYTSALRLLAETGQSAGRGLLGEAVLRSGQHLAPVAPDDGDLSTLLWRLFPADAVAWLEDLAEEHVAALHALLRGPDDAPTFGPLVMAAGDAAVVLAARISARSTASDVLARLPPGSRERSQFLELPRACERLWAALRAIGEGPVVEAAREVCVQTVSGCRVAVQQVLRRTNQSAVRTRLASRLEHTGAALDRLQALLRLLAPDRPQVVPAAATRLLASLVRARAEEHSVTDLVRSSMRSVWRRLVAHTGELGRDLIADSRAGFQPMMRATAGGVLAACAAALMLTIAVAALPLLFEGMAMATHHALSFMVPQWLAFTLATRQRSMTAAALVATRHSRADENGLRHLVGQVVRIFRS